MKVQLEPGKYVAAVSGGVDSVSLLHILKDVRGIDLVIAHFDHGIRSDSEEDRLFVEKLSSQYKLPFIYEEGKLSPGASEAQARQARYTFLYQVQKQQKAKAIITAHHQDDVLETVIINLVRGTGRKGLSSLCSREGLERPLLGIPKSEIISYARKHNLQWHEDSTNANEAYLRNYIRRQILPRFDGTARERLLELVNDSARTNQELDTLLVKYLPLGSGNKLERTQFNTLPDIVAREFMATWLRDQDIRDFDSKTLERLVVAAKTALPNSQFDIQQSYTMKVGKHSLALSKAER